MACRLWSVHPEEPRDEEHEHGQRHLEDDKRPLRNDGES